MTTFTPEMIEKARAAKTAEELQILAKESNFELTEESAAAYFAQLHPASGEMADDELENVSGGGCYKGDRLVVTLISGCKKWTCPDCGTDLMKYSNVTHEWRHWCSVTGETEYPYGGYTCSVCKYISYEKGLWLCNNPKRMK